MYEPVLNSCLAYHQSNNLNKKYLSFNQINNIHNTERLDQNLCIGSNNNLKIIVPPRKPPRKFQRTLSLKHSFSEEINNPIINKMRNNGTGDLYVDVDQIHIGLSRNNKKSAESSTDAEVQTTHLIPYRLRFWPKSACDFKLNPSETNCSLKCKCCFRIFSQWLLSQAGLILIVSIWALIGAYAFYLTEGPREEKQSATLAEIQRNLSKDLAKELLLNQSKDHAQNIWPEMIHKYLEQHETLFLEAVGAGFGEGGGGNIWTYPGCILFSVSLLTTLGFGAPVPRTPLGRCTAVIFALIGIPLHFLLVLNVGNLSAIRIQQFAFRSTNKNASSIISITKSSADHQPKWLKWLPLISVLSYFLLGVVLFGFIRSRDAVQSFMFPLDFTASGGVASVPGIIRIFYALYLEIAVTLAAFVVSLIQSSVSNGIVDVGLKWGLLTNT